MNEVFNNRNFWKLYLSLRGYDYDEENDGEIINELEEEVVEEHFEELKKDFKIFSEDYETTYQDKTYEGTTKSVLFIFLVGAFELLIEYTPDVQGCSTNLYLFHNDEEYFLGWRDCARWHPYCIKYDEFLLILAQIQRHDKQWKDAKIPLLLLKDFVGFGGADEADRLALSQQADDILKELNIKDSESLAACNGKEKYAWIETELGWEFTAKYSCYSLRNADHKDSKEGKFPFKLWKELMKEIKRQAN